MAASTGFYAILIAIIVPVVTVVISGPMGIGIIVRPVSIIVIAAIRSVISAGIAAIMPPVIGPVAIAARVIVIIGLLDKRRFR